MGKLLKLQIKENLKTLIWIWLIPLVFSAAFIILNRSVDNGFTQVGMAISIMLLLLGIGISSIIVIYQDYQRFFGREAIFYQSLPISPGASIWSRFFAYLISFILIVVVLILDFWVIKLASGSSDFADFKDSFDFIAGMFGQMSLSDGLTLTGLILVALIFSIHNLIFCMGLGSQKAFKSMGIFGPILMLILVQIILQILFILLLKNLPEGVNVYLEKLSHMAPNSFEEYMYQLRPLHYALMGSGIVLTGIFAAFSTYLQNRKLSVG